MLRIELVERELQGAAEAGSSYFVFAAPAGLDDGARIRTNLAA